MLTERLIILGSGPAGYTSSIYAARAGLDPLLIQGNDPGGQLTTTTDVENWPGDSNGLQGPDLMKRMQEHASSLNVRMMQDHIAAVTLGVDGLHELQGTNHYKTQALIISTGASAKYLGLASEQDFLGQGVSACATCDGFFYRGKDVAVVGGGNTAAEEALYLSGLAKTVTLIHRRDKLRCEKILANRVADKVANGNIKMLWNTNLQEVLGDSSGVTGINVHHQDTNTNSELSLDGVFIAIGHTPNTSIFEGQLAMKQGYLQVNSGQNGQATACSIPGVFASGDVADSIYRQAITSAGSGCMAALDAEKYLAEIKL